jgi:sugar/nucleoside kinase (ribokinase family)
MKKKNTLLIVASLAYDGIDTGEQKIDHILGGAGSYICLSVKHFNLSSGIVSVVGNDFKESDLKLLESCGVNLDGVEIITNQKSFYWRCIYKDNFKERITLETVLNVMENFKPIVPIKQREPDIMLLGNLHPEIQLLAMTQITNKPKAIILDTINFWIEKHWDTLEKVISKVDIISINVEEAELITREKDIEKASRILHKMGPRYVIIKKGVEGAELFGDGKKYCAPAYILDKVIDPTGAGDCFIGGIA